jgi:RNA polymerase subunit RPABC4/transcription elongation factor Spt4
MRLCFSCNRITTGDPLFCNHCGRSYDLKLCKRLHPNSRSAEVCSQCGSRELSIPQPRAPWYLRPLLLLLAPLPGLILWVGTVAFFFLFLRVLVTDQRLLFPMMLVGLMIGILWFIYVNLPSPAKKGARWIARKAINRGGNKGRH